MTDQQAPPTRHRKYLAVVDDTEESRLALRFAARRASRIDGGRTVLLHVIPPMEFVQWGGVQDVMEQEAQEKALAVLEQRAKEVQALTAMRPELILSSGQSAEKVMETLASDKDIYALVLATSPKGEPGPLVEYFTGPQAAGLPCLIILVPGRLSEAAIDDLVGAS